MCLEHLTTIIFESELDRYITFNNNSKIFNWVRRPFFEVPELQVHCEMKYIAEQLIELQSR